MAQCLSVFLFFDDHILLLIVLSNIVCYSSLRIYVNKMLIKFILNWFHCILFETHESNHDFQNRITHIFIIMSFTQLALLYLFVFYLFFFKLFLWFYHLFALFNCFKIFKDCSHLSSTFEDFPLEGIFVVKISYFNT